MTRPNLDQRLVDAAINFVQRRFPDGEWAGAAAMYVDDGEILISTALDVVNQSVALCHEVGAMCEAFARGREVVASVCVARDPGGRFVILAACGVCQERFRLWGDKVQIAVPDSDDPTAWQTATLEQLGPHYWRNVLRE